MTALQQFERLHPSMPIAWDTLALDLRYEAEQYTGNQRQKRLDRAELCDARARKAVSL